MKVVAILSEVEAMQMKTAALQMIRLRDSLAQVVIANGPETDLKVFARKLLVDVWGEVVG